MFTPEQKRYVYDNSVKVNDQEKYIEIMGLYSTFFDKAKRIAIKRKIAFVFLLLVIAYLVCQKFMIQPLELKMMVFRGAAIFVGTLIVLKLGLILLNYIDDMPTVKKIQQKECDLLCYEGDLNDVTKFVNYKSASSALYDYFMTVSGTKYDIDKQTYKVLLPHKGKKIRIYYFAELLTRQMLISEASIIMIVE